MIKELARRIVPSRLWTALRLARLRWTISRYPARDVTHRYGGGTLTIHLADPTAEGWYDHDWDEPPEIALLRQHRLRSGARVFDIGAHQGVVALMLAHAVGPSGQVVAVEASPHNAAVARRNRDRNNGANIEVVHSAAAERAGTIIVSDTLNAEVDDGSGEWGRVEVPAVTVDDLARRFGKPDLLYVDVEGFECAVLRGAAETLKSQPDAFVEVHAMLHARFGGSVEEVLRSFPEDRYERFLSPENEPRFRPFAPGDPLLNEGRFFLVAIARKPHAEQSVGNGPSRT